MITRDLPAPQPSKVIDCGNPWHGITQFDALDYGTGSMDWITPDSGDCYLIQVPGAPGSAQETSLNPDHQWLDYGLLSGHWQRQLYGKPLPGGRLSWVYSAGIGSTYIMDASGLDFNPAKTHFGGTLTRKSTRASSTPPATSSITTNQLALPSGAGSGHWDIIAIHPSGSEVIIGLWAGGTYTESDSNRGLASITASAGDYTTAPYRTAPDTLLKLTAGGTITVHKTLSEMVVSGLTSSSSSGPSWSFFKDTYITASHISGPSNQCHWEDYAMDTGYDDGTGTHTFSRPLGPTSLSIETLRSERIIVGTYYKADGSLALVELVKSNSQTSEMTVGDVIEAGSFAWNYGSEWNGTTCTSVGASIDPDVSAARFTQTTVFEGRESIGLYVDGVKLSEVQINADKTTEDRVISSNGAVSNIGLTKTTAIVADGAALGSAAAEYYPNSTSKGTLAAYLIADDIRVHVVRYSNHAYGLMLCNLPGSRFSSPAYLLGIVNVLTGDRASAIGYLSAPNDTIEYPHKEISVTVHPVTGAEQTTPSGPHCFV